MQINSKCLEITAIDRKECLKSGQIKVRLTGDTPRARSRARSVERSSSATRTLVLYSRDGDVGVRFRGRGRVQEHRLLREAGLVLQKRGVVGADGSRRASVPRSTFRRSPTRSTRSAPRADGAAAEGSKRRPRRAVASRGTLRRRNSRGNDPSAPSDEAPNLENLIQPSVLGVTTVVRPEARVGASQAHPSAVLVVVHVRFRRRLRKAHKARRRRGTRGRVGRASGTTRCRGPAPDPRVPGPLGQAAGPPRRRRPRRRRPRRRRPRRRRPRRLPRRGGGRGTTPCRVGVERPVGPQAVEEEGGAPLRRDLEPDVAVPVVPFPGVSSRPVSASSARGKGLAPRPGGVRHVPEDGRQTVAVAVLEHAEHRGLPSVRRRVEVVPVRLVHLRNVSAAFGNVGMQASPFRRAGRNSEILLVGNLGIWGGGPAVPNDLQRLALDAGRPRERVRAVLERADDGVRFRFFRVSVSGFGLGSAGGGGGALPPPPLPLRRAGSPPPRGRNMWLLVRTSAASAARSRSASIVATVERAMVGSAAAMTASHSSGSRKPRIRRTTGDSESVSASAVRPPPRSTARTSPTRTPGH